MWHVPWYLVLLLSKTKRYEILSKMLKDAAANKLSSMRILLILASILTINYVLIAIVIVLLIYQ